MSNVTHLSYVFILHQKQEGKERVIAYASRSLKPSEKKYPAHKLEFLALKWAVTEKFHDYLYGNQFIITTDNNPLTYVNTTAKLDAAGHRWLASLAAFDFQIQYKPGKLNTDADALSRRPHETVQVSCSSIQAICVAAQVSLPLAECVATGSCPLSAGEDYAQLSPLKQIDWKKAQSQDADLSRVIDLVRDGCRPRGKNVSLESVNVQKYLREWKKLHLEGHILYRTASLDGQQVRQLVIPAAYKDIALSGVHDEAGHQAKDKTLWLARQRFY